MTALVVPEDPTPADAPPQRLVTIVAASGWWVLTAHKVVLDESGGSYRATDRQRVAAWAHIAGESGWDVIALVAGDSHTLTEPHAVAGAENYLWHDGESWCHCGAVWSEPDDVDDITWCTTCAGVIGSP